jgi:hypothetical protein
MCQSNRTYWKKKKNKPIFLKKEERVRPPRENPILSRKFEFIMSKKK